VHCCFFGLALREQNATGVIVSFRVTRIESEQPPVETDGLIRLAIMLVRDRLLEQAIRLDDRDCVRPIRSGLILPRGGPAFFSIHPPFWPLLAVPLNGLAACGPQFAIRYPWDRDGRDRV
jgi:hypothetical protein